MTDVDFEELDKAVNSILQPDKSDSTSVSENVSQKTNTQLNTNNDLGQTKVNTETKTNSSEISKPAIGRTSGRFMDVVHPSSDMKSVKADDRVPPKPVSREASTISPPKKVDMLESGDSNLDTKDASSKLEKPKDPEIMPDPIDVSDSLEKKAEAADQANNGPNSPFLPDAKVDKRPLGAYSDNVPSLGDNPPKFQESKEEVKPFDTPMPAELDPKLLSIESGGVDEVVQPKTPETSTNQQTVTDSGSQFVESKSVDSEQPASGSIYDTKEYHTPINHPAKKSAGWMMVVWSILIIAVCGGIAVAVYMFVLPK